MAVLEEAFTTIRHNECNRVVLTKNGSAPRCAPCNKYRNTLLKATQRIDNERSTAASSKVRYSYNTKEELQERLRETQNDRQVFKRKSLELEAQIKELIERESIIISEELESYVKETLRSTTPDENVFPVGSPQHFLWSQQVEQAQKADKRGMRWHPLMIRWCLALRHKSPAAYRQLRNSGFLALPSESTLKQYTSFTKPTSGFNEDILETIIRESDMDNGIEDFKRNVALIYDEMKISSGLVYSRGNGKLRGFTESGGINDELDAFHQQVDEKKPARPLATYVNVFMVRGLFSKLANAFGYFAGQGYTSGQLFPLVWLATAKLEAIGFYVRCFVSDGASPNRKFYRIHGDTDLVYKISNFHCPERMVYFISDPPHLIKTVRNNLENSHGHNNTRNLMRNNQQISWQHILSVVEWDMNGDVPGLRLLPKVKYDHVNLKPRLRMRVNLAAQILSASVGHALEMEGKVNTRETREFVNNFDKFFDMLNVTRKGQDQRERKPAKAAYTRVDDWRFKWLKDTFLEQYINQWHTSSMALVQLPKDERVRLCLSHQTLEGIRITVTSFCELVPQMLQIEGVKYFLSEKLSQDPLEEYFSKQRAKGGFNDNPTLSDFSRTFVSLTACNSEVVKSLRGNTRGTARVDTSYFDPNDERTLPKRKRKSEE